MEKGWLVGTSGYEEGLLRFWISRALLAAADYFKTTSREDFAYSNTENWQIAEVIDTPVTPIWPSHIVLMYWKWYRTAKIRTVTTRLLRLHWQGWEGAGETAQGGPCLCRGLGLLSTHCQTAHNHLQFQLQGIRCPFCRHLYSKGTNSSSHIHTVKNKIINECYPFCLTTDALNLFYGCNWKVVPLTVSSNPSTCYCLPVPHTMFSGFIHTTSANRSFFFPIVRLSNKYFVVWILHVFFLRFIPWQILSLIS